MSEMVELVARAIRKSEAWSSFWSVEDSRIMARAAIAAMREPTGQMCKAGIDGLTASVPASAAIWRAMIGEALK